MKALWALVVWHGSKLASISPIASKELCEAYKTALSSERPPTKDAVMVIECRDLKANPLRLRTADKP